jgi:hypothetical protein
MDMNPAEFLRTIYLGDRACTGIVVASWQDEVKVRVDLISRVRGPTWNYYNDENLEGGAIVFEKVTKLVWDASGRLPNDEIRDIRAVVCDAGESRDKFEIEVGGGGYGIHEITGMVIAIYADGVCLEDASGQRFRA